MTTTIPFSVPDFLKLLAHDVRWQLVTNLAAGDRRVQELVALLQRPQNLISYHLRQLRDHHLVTERRSSADGRDVYYSLDLGRLRALYRDGGQALHPALACFDDGIATSPPVSVPPTRVLFLCTQNSGRSQLAEGILRAKTGPDVQVFSAGSEPARVHPLAIRAAAELGVDISQQQSKHMDQFVGQQFDLIITVCDQVREVCPVFPDDPEQIHWSLPDPASVSGTEEDRLEAFRQTARELATRIDYLQFMISHQPS